MKTRLFKRFWTHLLLTFYGDSYTAEGFEKTQKKFELPENLSQMDPHEKRQVTICNLFANQNLSIHEIVRVLDSSPHQVVPALIENGLIKERRRKKRGSAKDGAKASRASLSILPEEDRRKDAEAQAQATEMNRSPNKEKLQSDRLPPSDVVSMTPSNKRIA
jgi:hypothetical protein